MKHHITDHAGVCILCGTDVRNTLTGHRKNGAEHLPMSERWCQGIDPIKAWPCLVHFDKVLEAMNSRLLPSEEKVEALV